MRHRVLQLNDLFMNIYNFVAIFCIIFTGPKHRQRFLCELKVEGHNYVGAGNSATKKEAQTNAAKDFVNYLVRSGNIAAVDVPEDVGVKVDHDDTASVATDITYQPQRPVFQV